MDEEVSSEKLQLQKYYHPYHFKQIPPTNSEPLYSKSLNRTMVYGQKFVYLYYYSPVYVIFALMITLNCN